jgi:hypothetical protein
MKAIPIRMSEFIGDSAPERRTGNLKKSMKNFFRPHDPEHIKTAESI